MTSTDEIDASANLYLEEIGGPKDNQLRLRIVEAKSGGAPCAVDDEPDEVLREILRTATNGAWTRLQNI